MRCTTLQSVDEMMIVSWLSDTLSDNQIRQTMNNNARWIESQSQRWTIHDQIFTNLQQHIYTKPLISSRWFWCTIVVLKDSIRTERSDLWSEDWFWMIDQVTSDDQIFTDSNKEPQRWQARCKYRRCIHKWLIQVYQVDNKGSENGWKIDGMMVWSSWNQSQRVITSRTTSIGQLRLKRYRSESQFISSDMTSKWQWCCDLIDYEPLSGWRSSDDTGMPYVSSILVPRDRNTNLRDRNFTQK